MKRLSLLSLMLLLNAIALPPQAVQANNPKMVVATATPQIVAEQNIQSFINSQRYDDAMAEVQAYIRQIPRGSIFDIFNPFAGLGRNTTDPVSYLDNWTITIGQSAANSGHYAKAFELANRSKRPWPTWEIATVLHKSGQTASFDRLFAKIQKDLQKMPQIERQQAQAHLAGSLFNVGMIDRSNQLIDLLLRELPTDLDQRTNQQITIIQSAGIYTQNLDRTVAIAQRMDLSKNIYANMAMVNFAIEQKRLEVADRYIKGVADTDDSIPELRYNLGELYLTQKQLPKATEHLSYAILLATLKTDRIGYRDDMIERVALLYQTNKQPKLAQATVSRILNRDRANQAKAKLAQVK